jgi:O-antigen/teichoic acid export membrane protein
VPEASASDLRATAKDERGLLRNAGALVSSRLIVAALGWVGSILIVRALSPEDWGQFSLIFTVLGMVSFMSSLGSSRIVLRELTRGEQDPGAYAGAYVVLRGLLGLFAYACAVGFVVLAGYPEEVVRGTALAGVVLVIAAAGSGLDVVFQAHLRMGVVATASVLGQVVQLALVVLVAVTAPALLLFVLPAIAFDVVATAWKAARVRRLLSLRPAVNARVWWAILKQAAPLAAGTACATVAVSVDLIVLSQVDSFSAVGSLAVADKFVVLVAFVPKAVGPPLVALLVRAWPAQVDRFYETLRRATLLLAVLGGLVLVGFLPVAGDLLATLYGEEYRDTADAARLSVLAGCILFYVHAVLAVLVAMGRNRDFLRVNALWLLLTATASLLLVPRLSVLGAGLARLVAAAGLLVAVLLLARRRLAQRSVDRRRLVLVLVLAVLATAVGLALQAVLWWPLSAGVAVFLYLGLLELTRATGPAGLRGLAREPSGSTA